MIGSTLDKYEVIQKVGEGGMATVYRGRHTTLGRDVAIKVLHPHLSSSTRNRKRFAREARAIEHLRHDNILEIFDYSGADAEDCYIVTEFVGGDTLTVFMDEHGKLPSEVASIIGIALAQALTYAHGSGVLHRDLKPDNVMIRYDGTVKLMDFGIARFLDESQVTMTGALVGSPAFMSPEQAKEEDLDLRSDLFSLGTLLFFLTSGHLPFAGSNPSLILKNIIEGNRPQLAELAPSASASLCDVVERLLQIDREERFDDARQVAEALQATLAEVRIDPTTPRWSLSAWLEDPDAYARALDHDLRDVLLDEGRRLLEAGDAIAALRLLNRLLAIDEDNPEVLELIQGLHVEEPRRRRGPIILVAVAVLLAASAFFVIGLVTDAIPIPSLSAPPTEPVETRLEVVEPPPVDAVVAPTPTPVDTDVPARSGANDSDTPRATPTARPDPPRTSADPKPSPPLAALPPGSITPVVIEPISLNLPKTGYLEVRVPRILGTVYVDGQPEGWKTNSPDPLELTPGNHTVTVRNPLARDRTFDVTVAAGETVRREVTLDLLPVAVTVPDDWGGECAVQIDGTPRGTLSELGFGFDLPRAPGATYAVDLVCKGDPKRFVVDRMDLLAVTLPTAAGP